MERRVKIVICEAFRGKLSRKLLVIVSNIDARNDDVVLYILRLYNASTCLILHRFRQFTFNVIRQMCIS